MADNRIWVDRDAWIQEIEDARPEGDSRSYSFTNEMDKDLLLMRNPGNGKNPLYWKDVVKLWRKKYGKASDETLRTRLKQLMGENSE